MKKKYFGNKIEEEDYIIVERSTLKDKENNILEVNDKQINDNDTISDSLIIKRTEEFNKYGDKLSSNDVTVPEIEDDSSTEDENGKLTIVKYLTKTFEKKEIKNSDKLSGDLSEFYSPEDKFSARNLNRPIFENFEDTENIYELMQNVCKTLYGQKKNGILPDVFEELNSNNLKQGRYLNKNKRYIRIPTGAFFAKLTDKQAKYYKYTKTEDNQYSRDFYVDNDHNAAVIFNRPNVELFERQLAEHFNINLNDQDNDVKLNYYFVEDNSPKTKITDDRAESVAIKDNAERYNRKREIRYYINVSRTNYNYQKNTAGNTIITTNPKTERVPAYEKYDPSDSFELIRIFGNSYKNYLSRIDDFFSLEEVIEFPLSADWQSGNYVIFFDPKSKKVKYNEKVMYSYSGKYGLCSESNFKKLFDDTMVIKLYTFTATFNNYSGVTWIDNKDSEIPINIVAKCCLEKIDRTTFDIKNINVENLLNDLVFENKNSNVNISEAHIKPDSSEKDNISIGFFNLGYSDEAQYSQKKDNKTIEMVGGKAISSYWFGDDVLSDEARLSSERDRTLYSEGDKYVLGENNIAIGSYSLKNTVKIENKLPKNNIAIGKNTLSNVYNGSNNIEIGYGNGNVKNPNHLINIGNNFSKENSNAEDYNIVVGYNNADYLNLKTENIIFGFKNNYNNNTASFANKRNVVIGIENILENINSNNTIIGNYNSYDNNYTSSEKSEAENKEILNSEYNVGTLNYILGNSNVLKNLVRENIILGNNNQKNIEANGSYNIVIGNDNNFKFNNFVAGKNNNVLEENSISIGNDNNLLDGSNNKLFGKENILNSTTNSVIVGSSNSLQTKTSESSIFGSNNNLTTSSKTIVVGNNNIEKNSKEQNNSNFIVGKENNISDGTNNFVIGNSNVSTKGKNNIIFGESNDLEDLSDSIVIGKDSSLSNYKSEINDSQNKVNDANPLEIDGGKEVSKNNLPAVIIGNYTNSDESKYFIKLDKNNNAFVNAEDITFASKNLYIDGPITSPRINARGFIFQNPGIVYDKPENELYNSLVPNAGKMSGVSTDISSLNNITKYKSFIGTGDSSDDFLISVRDKNGYGENKTFAICFHSDNVDNNSRLSFKIVGGDKNLDRYVIDSYGGQTINGDITLKTNNNNKINLNPNSTSVFSNSVQALSFISVSSKKLKTNIEPTKYNALDEINKIKVVDFYFKSDKSKENPKIGFIAEDTDSIFSTKNKNSMDLYNSIGMLFKAVQELTEENKKLKERLNKIEK